MGKALLPAVVAGATLVLSAQSLDAQEPHLEGLPTYQEFLCAAARALIPALSGHLFSRSWDFSFNPKSQNGGGGDGSGSGDGTGDGDGAAGPGTSTGDSTSTSADDDDDEAAPTAVAPTGPTTAVNADTVNAPTAPTDPTTISVTPEISAIEAIPTTDPRGGYEPTNTSDPVTGPGGLATGTLILPTGTAEVPVPTEPGAPVVGGVDVPINAVIVSGASSPMNAIGKGPGVRNVIITGGVIALGTTPLPSEGPSPFRLIPDLRYLNGSIFPPVVPNIIDVRIMSNPIQAVENPPG